MKSVYAWQFSDCSISLQGRRESARSHFETVFRLFCAICILLLLSDSAFATDDGILCRKHLGGTTSAASFAKEDQEIVDALNERIIRTRDPYKNAFELVEAPLHSSLEGKKWRPEDWFAMVKATYLAHEEKFWQGFAQIDKIMAGDNSPDVVKEARIKTMQELEQHIFTEVVGLFRSMGLKVLPMNIIHYSRGEVKGMGQTLYRRNGIAYYHDHATQRKKLGFLVLPAHVKDVPSYIQSGGLLTFYLNTVHVESAPRGKAAYNYDENSVYLNLNQLLVQAQSATDMMIRPLDLSGGFVADHRTLAEKLLEEAKKFAEGYAETMDALFLNGFELDENGRPAQKPATVH